MWALGGEKDDPLLCAWSKMCVNWTNEPSIAGQHFEFRGNGNLRTWQRDGSSSNAGGLEARELGPESRAGLGNSRVLSGGLGTHGRKARGDRVRATPQKSVPVPGFHPITTENPSKSGAFRAVLRGLLCKESGSTCPRPARFSLRGYALFVPFSWEAVQRFQSAISISVSVIRLNKKTKMKGLRFPRDVCSLIERAALIAHNRAWNGWTLKVEGMGTSIDPQAFSETIELLKNAKPIFEQAQGTVIWPTVIAAASAIIGTLAAYFPKFWEAQRQRRQLRISVAIQLYSEIKGILAIERHRGYIKNIEDILALFQSGVVTSYSWSIQTSDDKFPIYYANIQNLGVLEPVLQQKIVLLYQLMESAIQDMQPGGILNAKPVDRRPFSGVLNILRDARRLGDEIIAQIESEYLK